MNLQPLFDDLDSANVAWERLHAILTAGGFDLARQRPTFQGQSFELFSRRVVFIFGTLLSLQPVGDEDLNAVVLGGQVAPLRKLLQVFLRHAEVVRSQLSEAQNGGRTIRDGNDAFLIQIVEKENVVQQHDCNGSFTELFSVVNQLTLLVGSLLPLCKATAAGDFEDTLRILVDVQRQATSMQSRLMADRESLSSMVESTQQLAKEVRDSHTQAQTLITSIRELQSGASSDSANVSGLVERIRQTSEEAEKLSTLVNGYQAKFELFQTELDARNVEFQKHEETAIATNKQNTDNGAEINRLIALADSMIAGANTVGLSVSMEEARKRYQSRMAIAGVGFLLSVLILAVSALPLAAHLVPGLFGTLLPVVADNANAPWYSVLGKLLLLAPATWMTGFFTKSFADFFHLEREYAHKAALAKAVEGFRRQAPKFEEEITAEVFMEVRTNPAKGNPAEPAAHPLYDILSKTVGKVLERKSGGE